MKRKLGRVSRVSKKNAAQHDRKKSGVKSKSANGGNLLVEMTPLYRSITFTIPDRLVYPPGWIAHIPFAFWLISVVKPKRFVELGVHSGNSYCAFLQAVSVLRQNTECFAVDHWLGDEQSGHYGEQVFEELRTYHDPRYAAFSTLLRKRFDEALNDFSDGTIDLLHLDGLHTYEAVSHDFTSWLPKMSKSGLILFHDITVRQDNFGVWQFWEEIAAKFSSFSFIHSHGLGIVYVGQRPMPKDLGWLFAASQSPNTSAKVRRYFASLGDRLLQRYNAVTASTEVAQLRTQRLQRDELLTTRDGEVEQLRTQLVGKDELLTTRDGEVAELRTELVGKDELLTTRDGEVAELRTQLVRKNELLATRDGEVAELRTQLVRKNELLATRDGEVARLRAELVGKDELLTTRDGEVEQLRTELVGKDELLTTRDGEVEQLRTELVRKDELLANRDGEVAKLVAVQIRANELEQKMNSFRFLANAVKKKIAEIPHDLRRRWPISRSKQIWDGLLVLFETNWYLAQNPDVAAQSTDPLQHYLRIGGFEGRDPSPHFDSDWYLSQNPDVAAKGINPLLHYLKSGASEGRDPSPNFDTDGYLSQHPEVAVAGLNPLVHHVRQLFLETDEVRANSSRDVEQRRIEQPEKRNVAQPAPSGIGAQTWWWLNDREEYREIAATPIDFDLPARLIAFYLPQFYPTQENDAFWGKGFTEWTNVTRAIPQFAGHYQPRLPGELGFYDLRMIEVQRRQVELAKLYGISGFCFYFYWFNGRRLLDLPVENYLKTPSLDLPFCLCWANENWTRTWDGLNKHLLVEQHYSAADDLKFIENVSRYFRDPRYITVQGKPLLLVYRPRDLPSARETASRWRAWAAKAGFGDLYLAYVQSFETRDPRKYDFDAAVEFPPNVTNPPRYPGKLSLFNANYKGNVLDWDHLVRRSRQYPQENYKIFRGVCPSWDNESRRSGRGTVLLGSSPAKYCEWVKNAVADTVQRFGDPSEQLVFVNAWNEWAEGAYLEPDRRYGYAFLQATRDALEAAQKDSSQRETRILIVGHDAHPHGAQFVTLNLLTVASKIPGIVVECVLLRDGILRAKYEEICRVHCLNGEDAEGRLAIKLATDLARRDFKTAICSTTVSGNFIKTLKNCGFSQVIGLVHELPHVIENYEGRGLKREASNVSKFADKIVFPGEQISEAFDGCSPFDPEKAVILPQGLYRRNRFRTKTDKSRARASLRSALGLTDDVRVALAVGFGDSRKGIDLFVQIGDHVLSRFSDIVFVWVGEIESAMRQKVMKSVSHSKHAKHFVFPGFCEDLDVYFAGADIFLLTSREDPFPTVVLAAAEIGLPIVGFTGIGASESTLNQYKLGKFVTAFDTARFGDEVIELLKEHESPLHNKQGAALIAREFSFQKYGYDVLAAAQVPVKAVSVIVPNYNYKRFLEQRLKSIEAQKVPPYEVIVLDDASTDGSADWLDQYLTAICPSAQLVQNIANSGSVFRQWLKGVMQARGEFVWIAEADDISEPDFLLKVLAPFEDPGVVLSYCQSRQISEQGQVLSPDYLEYVSDVSQTKWLKRYVNQGENEITTALAVKNTIPNVSAVVFRRTALIRVIESQLGKLENFRVAGDWLVYVELLRRGKIAFCPEPLNSHRRHASSVTIGSFNADQLREIVKVQRFIRENFDVPQVISETADRYAQILFDQFGLSTPAVHKIWDHKEFKDFAAVVRGP